MMLVEDGGITERVTEIKKKITKSGYENKTCPVCSGTGHPHHTHDNYPIDECQSCGFVYTRTIPSVEFLKNFYEKQYLEHEKDGTYIPKQSLGLKQWVLATLFEFLNKDSVTEKKRLLEIGCSQGDLLMQYKDRPNWVATGIDYGGAAIKFAKSRGLDAHVSDVESMNFENNSFDAVVALHVMEHVYDLNGFIQEIHRITKVGGYFFAVMPSLSHWKPKMAGNKWKYWGPPGHLWYFTNGSLERFLKNNGFEVKHCSSFYHRAHVRVLARKIQR